MDSKEIIKIREQAELARKEGRNEKAMSLMKEYLSLVHPSFTHYCWFFIAEILLEKNKITEALEHCDEALRIMKDFIPGLELRIKIHKSMGNFPEAKKDQTTIDDIQAREKKKWDDPNHYYHYK
ncbi:tetratricopeptide repeat protein [Leptospira perdikensis]|uniref:Tetratricopeptide repeat protein n=1 Tax=Leptospira perdikensis TaxID=2484948 RepID=A0A4R9JLI1_9LEPT|nr:tetratricopeptide repeat protein [Leptospira perdikensis]TGL45938.1 tetratricopeptide repeat protein [Leptospira perdikensis]